MIGLAQKAGKTASGEFSTEKAVKTGCAALVIVSTESSDNTKKIVVLTWFHLPESGVHSSEATNRSRLTREFKLVSVCHNVLI